MPRQNVEITRRAYEAFERGDMDAALADADPDFVTYRSDPESEWRGKDGFFEAWADWTEGFTDLSLHAEEFVDAGDHVVARVIQRATGRASGVPVESEFWFVHTLRDGKFTRFEIFPRKARAFEAAGLPHPD